MKLPFLLTFLLFNFIQTCGQNSTNEKIEIQFSQAWVWEYENDLIPENEFGNKGEMVVYCNEKLNYWLLTNESFGSTGEMVNWILLKKSGEILMNYSDEFGNDKFLQDKLDLTLKIYFPKELKYIGNIKWFNQNQLGFHEIKGKEYELNYLNTNNISKIFLAKTSIDFSMLYRFNSLNFETKLPISFPQNLPGNYLILEDKSQLSQGRIHFKLKEISHTEYFIQLPKN